jgi:ABC-2 type transport system permease protein
MNEEGLMEPPTRHPYRVARPATIAWVIAGRHIRESLRNRSTYVMGAFYVLLPLVLAPFTLRPLIESGRRGLGVEAGLLMAVYLLMAGLLPCTWSVGIAAGAFAAEKERGSLTPLLATPASNASIFVGKVLGAVLPAVSLALISVGAYLVEILLLFGPRGLGLLPAVLALLIVALLPATSLLGAGVSAMISARVTTEQAANQYGSLILTLIWFGLLTAVLQVLSWGILAFAGVVALLFALAIGLVLVSAATWRREEVMARR